ncbi:hypothetical protein CRG98_000557 [Punica granatum]|uniref:Uncharacterized protein n=1 Tax=Punica granatum TaxID=22663 RepID=A0A2I0LFS7_PUNGR|nr:hypothetical protein CRG98_000557 [Punica granatum]
MMLLEGQRESQTSNSTTHIKSQLILIFACLGQYFYCHPDRETTHHQGDQINQPVGDDKVAVGLATIQRHLDFCIEEARQVNALDSLLEIGCDDLQDAPSKLEDLVAEVQDPLKEVNKGTTEEPRVTYESQLLSSKISAIQAAIAENAGGDDAEGERGDQTACEGQLYRIARYVDRLSNIVSVRKKNEN